MTTFNCHAIQGTRLPRVRLAIRKLALKSGTKTDEYGHDVRCFTAWHCTAATLHTESKSDEVTCWSDYMCFFINKRVNYQFMG